MDRDYYCPLVIVNNEKALNTYSMFVSVEAVISE